LSVLVNATNRIDSRLTKIFSLGERMQLHFNFEVFNTFNRVSDTSVITQAYQASAGVIRPLAGVGNGTASGGFPDGTNARRAQFSTRFIF